MATICPTITANNLADFEVQIRLVSSFADRVHVDFMDGVFAPTTSPKPSEVQLEQPALYDLHLMYQDPTPLIDEIIQLKPNLVIFQAESLADIPLLATRLRQEDIKTGLAILPETKVESVKFILPHVQHCLIFGGHLGYHGGQADLSQLQKASQILAYSRHIELAWDGGANNQNINTIKDAGITVINVGSAIHKADNPSDSYQELQALAL